MRKKYRIGTMFISASLCLVMNSFWSVDNEIINAQTSDKEYQKLPERDENVSQEKIDKAFAEAKKIQDEIVEIMAKEKPRYKLKQTFARHLQYSNPGDRGETANELSWENNPIELGIQVQLKLKKEGISKDFWFGLNGISMGEFFKVPDIGDEAILVKNVSANQKMTNVGMHFTKGRAMVDIYLNNKKRSIEKNEKELMEIVRLIEPLIIARDNFDD